MNPQDQQAGVPAIRRIAGRHRETTATLRCVAFAGLSELVASPHDLDPRPALREKIGVVSNLDYGDNLNALLQEFVAVDREQLKLEYSGLFEVGSNGPPLPIREDLQTGQRSGTREELVRFYRYFNYSLQEKFAWAPDHLSVQLEFMHFLCFHEASVEADAVSYQLAQYDFSERHLINWVPKFVAAVQAHAGDCLYSRVMNTLNDFLTSDLAWQGGTISAVAQ